MNNHHVKIESIRNITHDVLHINVEKTKNFEFTPGQTTEISINKGGWKNGKNIADPNNHIYALGRQ